MHKAASYRARAVSWNKVSAGWGPLTRHPSALSAAMAGSMTSISVLPSSPPSPECGLRPVIASLGSAIPNVLCSRRRYLDQWQTDVERRVGFARVVDGRDGAVPDRAYGIYVSDRDERAELESRTIVPAFREHFRTDSGRIA